MKKLNLGSGNDYKDGWVNLDYNSLYKTDVNHDLVRFPYPFKKDEFDYIYCSHVLEHVGDLFRVLRELERIVKKNGVLHIRVPHFSNGNGYNDLSHKRTFGWFTFNQLVNGYYNQKFGFKIVSKRFNWLAEKHEVLNALLSWVFNLMPKQFYERFLCWILPVGEIELVLRKI